VEKKEKAVARKVEIEARKAEVIANKASKLVSNALKTSTKVNKGKRKLVELTIEVGSTLVGKRVAFETSHSRAQCVKGIL